MYNSFAPAGCLLAYTLSLDFTRIFNYKSLQRINNEISKKFEPEVLMQTESLQFSIALWITLRAVFMQLYTTFRKTKEIDTHAAIW